MTRRAGRFTCNAFHGTTISEEAESVVIYDLETGLVKVCSSGSLRNGKANSIGEPLTQRACSDLNAWSILGFWMTRCDAIDTLGGQWYQLETLNTVIRFCGKTYSESLQIIDRDTVAKEVKQRVLQHTSVAVARNTAMSALAIPYVVRAALRPKLCAFLNAASPNRETTLII